MQKMKNSGVPWNGKIPEGWEISKVKYCFTLNVGLSITKENLCLDGIKCLNYGYIHGKNTTELNLDKDHLPFVPTTYLETHSKCLIHNGDFVFCDTSEDIVGSGNFVYILNDCEEKIFAGSHTIACKKTKQFNSSFLAYLCSTDIWKSQIQSKVTGTKVYSITQKILKEALVFFPPLQDQQRIANFLDAKCTKIDESAAKEKELIEKLKEYRQSIITEAVTKGLNPTAPMKDSGIDWIGDIPQHWEVVRLKYLCKIITGNKDTINRVPDGQYPFYVRSPKIERIDTYSFDGEAILMAGDGVGAGKVFHLAYGKFDFHQRVYNLHNLKKLLGKFLLHYLQENFWKEIEQGNAKSTVDSIRLPMLQNFPISIPPTHEQQEITTYLDRKTSLIDNAIQKKEELISKLEQYKKSLIYEAVTGKINV